MDKQNTNAPSGASNYREIRLTGVPVCAPGTFIETIVDHVLTNADGQWSEDDIAELRRIARGFAFVYYCANQCDDRIDMAAALALISRSS